jgi:CheY-like chemotaxis protein
MAGRILVLDDEENYAEMLQELLREHNYQVDMATRPQLAINQLEEIPYDLVISDYKMPVMDGADFLKKARELYPNLPFILVSGLMNTPELVKVANMSVTLVMEKPLDTDAFLSYVAKFADAMTEDEREVFDRGDTKSGEGLSGKTLSWPEAPRFFSAESSVSKSFMQTAWGISQRRRRSLFILEPVGGDANLAVKDLSTWSGHADQTILELRFEDFSTKDAAAIEAMLAEDGISSVVAVRLSHLEQIPEAQSHWATVIQSVDLSEDVICIYLLEGMQQASQFMRLAKRSGCVLPALCRRPVDVAQYALRVARRVVNGQENSQSVQFTPDAVFALLACEWPGNYQQLQAVIEAAVSGGGVPITSESLEGLLTESLPQPKDRLGHLLQCAQVYQFQSESDLLGLPVSTLAQRMDLGDEVQSEDDLKKLPLIFPKLSDI